MSKKILAKSFLTLAVFFFCDSALSRQDPEARVTQLGELVMGTLNTEKGPVETPKISKFKAFYHYFVGTLGDAKRAHLTRAVPNFGYPNDDAKDESSNFSEVTEADIPRVQGLGYLILLTQYYFSDLAESTIILEDGIYDGPESSLLPPQRVFVDEAVLETVKKNRLNDLEALHFIKNHFSEFYLDVLKDSNFANYVIASKSIVESVEDFVVYSYDSILVSDCVPEPTRAMEILEQFDLLPREVSYCPSELTKHQLLDCFESHDEFLEYLKGTKPQQVYVFLEGGIKLNPFILQQTERKYCQFLGGSWQLDKKNPEQMDLRSHVNFLTTSGARRMISAEELSKMRIQLRGQE